MKRNIKSLIGYSLKETDGEIGHVVEFYFDDKTWTVRYLVVETGSWFSEKKVLISPSVIKRSDWENEEFPVKLTKDQIKNSPDIDTEKTVSRQQEEQLSSYYSWDTYWGNEPYEHGAGIFGMMPSELYESEITPPESIDDQIPQNKVNSHLRGTEEIKGYKIHTTDGEIGKVVDFVVDDTNWEIKYLVIDTGSWLNSKKVILSTKWITDIQWDNEVVIVNISTDSVRNSPDYDDSLPINEDYEKNLNKYYGKA